MTKKQKTKVDELRDVLKAKREAGAREKAPPKEEEKKRPPEEEGIEAEELARQIRAAEEEAKGHYDKLLRVMAEFENFKKRMNNEREGLVRYGNEKLLSALLPALDDLDRVLDHISPDASEEAKKISDGVELVRKSLHNTLEKFGLKEVPAQGRQFDPSYHEAVAVVESGAHKPGMVMAVHRKGYHLFDRLLRAAMVTVAKEETPKTRGENERR
jgi:molecular chaperone GrpE